jgi:hypothetical protein
LNRIRKGYVAFSGKDIDNAFLFVEEVILKMGAKVRKKEVGRVTF